MSFYLDVLELGKSRYYFKPNILSGYNNVSNNIIKSVILVVANKIQIINTIDVNDINVVVVCLIIEGTKNAYVQEINRNRT